MKNLAKSREREWGLLIFVHDLGEGEKEGWEIAIWLTEEYSDFLATEPDLTIHSANPSVGKT